MTALHCHDLRKSFAGAGRRPADVRAVDGVDLEIADGEICALLGPSGCGKTTMLRLIAGFERPDAGSVRVAGEQLAGDGVFVAPERRRMGMVFQDYALFPHLDVARNVAYGLGRGRHDARVGELLELVGMSGLGGRLPAQLSGGQQQRVALARALAATPRLVLLDEPFSGLDAALRAQVRQEVRAILKTAGVAALFVTHDQEEALSLADTVAVMRDGRIEQVGTPEEVYGRPATRWVATFLGEADTLPAQAAGGYAECELARVPVEAHLAGAVDVLVRPEAIALSTGPGEHGGQAVPGEVVHREFFGHDQLVHVRLPSGQQIRSRSMSHPVWHPGDRVRVRVQGPVNVFPAPAPGPA
jgi:iron(III) transport system ATP-binding protein